MIAAWLGIASLSAWAAEGQPAGAPADPAPAPSDPAPAPADPAPDGGLSPEDLAAIEAALAADQSAAPAAPAAPAPRAAGMQSMNPDMSFIADLAFAYFSAEEPRMVGGHDPTQNGFTLQQLELSVGKPVDPYFRFDANIVFSLFGVEIEEVYATTLSLPGRLQLRAGQMLTRFGRSNATHPHAWNFVDQNLATGRVFGGEGNRGLGLELSWLAPLPWYVEFVGSWTGAAGESTARSFYGAEDGGWQSPLDFQSTLAIKQFFPLSPDLSLMWGLSAANGPNPTGLGNRTDVYGTDLYLKFRPITAESSTIVSLQAEALYRRMQVPEDIHSDLTASTELFWRISQRWGVAGRYEYGSPTTGLSGEVVTSTLDPEWIAVRQRGATSLTFWPSEFSRLRLQGEVDLAGWSDHPDWAALAAFEFNVGAHGAHAF